MTITFNYISETQQPTVAQLTPIVNNADPLHIYLGNPDLRPSVSHNFKFEFHRFANSFFNISLNINFLNNGISTKTSTDSLGRQISQPINVNGNHSIGLYLSVGRNLGPIGVSFHTNNSYNRTASYVNAGLSMNDVSNSGAGVDLNVYSSDLYSLQLNTNFIYFYQVSSIDIKAPVHYWAQNHSGSLTLLFLKKFEINANATYAWQGKANAFSNSTTVILWNSYVSRNLLDDKLVVKLQFNNILNQNAGISRSNANNVNTETSSNILGRYWMLSAIYRFDKKFRNK